MTPYYSGKIRNLEVVDVFVNSLIKELKLSRMKRDLDIQFVSIIDSGNTWGICHGDKDSVCMEIARKDIQRNLSFLEIMKVIAHEMVHAKQYFRGELVTKDCKQYWKGNLAESYTYYTAPWEQEARELEQTLFCNLFPFHMPFKN
jgi:hypothetical protein